MQGNDNVGKTFAAFISTFVMFASPFVSIDKRWQTFAVHLQYIRKERSRDDRGENIGYISILQFWGEFTDFDIR